MTENGGNFHRGERIIDAVIPSFYPDEKLIRLLSGLETQSVPLRTIRLINTEAAGLEKLITDEWFAAHPLVQVTHIKKEEFDHGGTRNLGMELSEGADFVLFMTQDAVPAGDHLVAALLRPFLSEDGTGGTSASNGAEAGNSGTETATGNTAAGRVAVSYARQLPAENATAAEKFSRAFNYPAQGRIKSAKDTGELGIKTFFCSNVCAMYRRDIFMEVGPFPSPVIFNEDMVYAGHAVQAGCRIAYAADAEVIHSHNYSAVQQFHRNFDLGVSQAEYPEIFASVSSEGEGAQYAKRAVGYLWKEGRGEIPGFLFTCGMRLLGYRLGKNYRKLSPKKIARYTMNPGYWEKVRDS